MPFGSVKFLCVLSEFMRNRVKFISEALGVVTAAAKAYVLSNLRNAVVRLGQQLYALQKPVIYEVLERRGAEQFFENAATFTLAYMRGIRNIVKRYFFRVVLMYEITQRIYSHFLRKRRIF